MRIRSRFGLISTRFIGCSLRNRESDVVITSTKRVHTTKSPLARNQRSLAYQNGPSMGIFLYLDRFNALEKPYGPPVANGSGPITQPISRPEVDTKMNPHRLQVFNCLMGCGDWYVPDDVCGVDGVQAPPSTWLGGE